MSDWNFDDYIAEREAEERLEKTGRSDNPQQKRRSGYLARKFFDVDRADDVQRGDIRNASSLLGVEPTLGMMWNDYKLTEPAPQFNADQIGGHRELNKVKEMGDVDRGLFYMGDAANHDPAWKRESAPLNSSLLDPLYSASDTVRDTVNEYVPAIGKAIDGADNWLFNATGGFLGTPENITPENQLNLRKAFRDQKEKDDAYRFERR